MTRTRYCRLEADDPAELARAVDVDALFEAVARALGHEPTVLAPYESWPVHLGVVSGATLNRYRQEATTCEVWGLCLTATYILLLRLDFPGPIAHELAHALGKLLSRKVSCAEAADVADAVA